MTEYYEKKMEFNLTERELIVLANNSLYEVGAQLDRVRGAMDQIEADQENSKFVTVRKDRLENLIEHSYETSCPLVDSSACHLNGPHFTCSDCEFNYDSLDDDSELPVKTVVKWLEGE